MSTGAKDESGDGGLDGLRGRFHVRRISGLLPPGVTKEIDGGAGRTLLFGIHFGSFQIEGRRLIYSFWPIVDEIEPAAQGASGVVGRGTVFGIPFCRFRLEPA